jgi:DNA-binding NarL/FixJ family response regulator
MSKHGSVVLIVGEPGPMRDSLKMALSALPQVGAVDLAPSAESALLAMAERSPALVVYDADMPGDNLGAVLAAVAKLQGKSLVIADSREQQIRAEAAGASIALLKGHRAARLLEIVESLLCHSDAEREQGRRENSSD